MIVHKHISTKKPKKPVKRKWVEKAVYVVSLAYPLTAVPQIIKIYTTQNVESFSLLSWLLYVVFGAIFMAYAFSVRLKPLMIDATLWLTVYLLVVAGILLYG